MKNLMWGGGGVINDSVEPDTAVGISVITDLIHVQSTKRRITFVGNLKKKIPFLFVKPVEFNRGSVMT